MSLRSISQALRRRALRTGALALGATGAASAAVGVWGLVETQLFTVRHRTVTLSGVEADEGPSSVLLTQEQAASEGTLRILHLSDIHLLARQARKRRWLASLADTKPDFVVLTGDLMAQAKALDALCETLTPFFDVPGAYVFGSNDYSAPHFKNPLSYFGLTEGVDLDKLKKTPELPWRELDATLQKAGWLNLTNTRAKAKVKGWNLSFVGVDDPHIFRDSYPEGAPSKPAHSAHRRMHIGLTHAPYQRVLDRMAEEGCDLIFAGHTHGGQICLPSAGALVTNCDLPRSHASGLFLWPPTGELPIRKDATVRADHRTTVVGLSTYEQHGFRRYAGAEKALASAVAAQTEQASDRPHRAWVNVSAGIGSSPFAPGRVACRPEAIIIDVLAA